MNDNVKTGIFAAVAVVAVLAAIWAGPKDIDPGFYNDAGEVFFADFTSPDQVARLEVTEFDEATASPETFIVTNRDGVWTIPSHSNYPADARTRMARAAGLFIGLTKASVRSDKPADYEALGVVNPAKADASSKGLGTLVTFFDKQDQVLASLIVGDVVEGRDGMRFVRVPGKKRTYVAKVPGEVDTDFSEWIETDLLQLDSWKLARIIFDNYSVNESTGRIELGEKLVAKKKDFKWSLDGLAENEELNEDKMRDVTSELDNIKIVGVRPKPEGLGADLKLKKGMAGQTALGSLMSRGYFLGPNDRIYSNEGDLIAATEDGVEYTLRFGEVLWGTGRAVTAGAEEKKDSDKAEEEKKKEGQKPNRFLLVSVRFDEGILEKPEKESLSQEELDKRQKARETIEDLVKAVEEYRKAHEKLPESLGDLTQGEKPVRKEVDKDPWGQDYVLRPSGEGSFEILSWGADQAEGGDDAAMDLTSRDLAREDQHQELFDKWKDYRRKIEDGKKEVKKLKERFGPWYYVINAESFDKLHLSRRDLVKPKEEKKDEKKDDEKDS